jgi:hypothetical protein
MIYSTIPLVNDNTPFRSRVIVVALQTGSKRHKIFLVVFGRDGSLYVTFPYFGTRIGIFAATSAPAWAEYITGEP